MLASSKKVVIIGAGVSSLAAAVLLSAKGCKVTVLESTNTYGGKVGLLKLGGATFDTGPSLCTDVKTIDDIYIKAGLNPRDYWDYLPTNEITRYFWQDGFSYIMPASRAQIERSLVRNFNVNINSFSKYYAQLDKAYQKSLPLYLDRQPSLFSTLSPSGVKALFAITPLLAQYLHSKNAQKLKDPKLVQIFDRFATYSGSDPFVAPAITALAGALELNDGAYYPIGGMRSIADGLYNAAKKLGVDFVFNSPVLSIKTMQGRVAAVVTKQGLITASHVLYGGDVAYLPSLLNNKAKTPKNTPQSRSTSAVVFYWVVKGNHKAFGLHTILFSNNYKTEYQALMNQKVPQDPTIYINCTSKLEPAMAPKGSENWFVMINVPAGTPDSAVDMLRPIVKKRIEACLGYGIDILAEDYLSPKRLQSKTGAWQGAIYGESLNSLGRMARRSRLNRTKYSNLYCIGGTVHPGGGIPLALRSAKIVAGML